MKEEEVVEAVTALLSDMGMAEVRFHVEQQFPSQVYEIQVIGSLNPREKEEMEAVCKIVGRRIRSRVAFTEGHLPI